MAMLKIILIMLASRLSHSFGDAKRSTQRMFSVGSLRETKFMNMKFSRDELRISILNLDSNQCVDIKTTYMTNDGLERSWIVRRTYGEYVKFHQDISSLVPIPLLPRRLYTASILETHIQNIISNVHSTSPDYILCEFLNMPQDLLDNSMRVYDAEVVDKYNSNVAQSADDAEVATNAAVAGVVLGGIIAGPIGAIAGGTGAAIASQKDVREQIILFRKSNGIYFLKGTAGEVARTMGRAVEITTKKIQKINK